MSLPPALPPTPPRYSNEAGKDPATGAPCDRGYWLVQPDGADAPVFAALQEFFSDAGALLSARAAGGGELPGLNEFRAWAVGKLANLTGYAAAGVPAPAVRRLDEARAALSGGH